MSTAAIAKYAGVSQATVSRVLNRHPGVSEQKVSRVKEAIEKLGYRPSASVRRRLSAIPNLRTGNVAVLILSSSMFQDYSSVFGRSLRAVEESLRDHHLNMIRSHTTGVDQLPPLIASREIDGLILAGDEMAPELAESLSGLPRSWITSHRENDGDAVLPGNELIGRMAAEYLLGRGHRRLAALNAFGGFGPASLRVDFFEFTATRAGATVARLVADAPARFPTTIDLNVDLDLELIERCVAEQVDHLLALDDRPTGLFVLGDHQMAMLYRVLAKRGLQPGKDLDLIGCDNEKAVLMGLYPRPATINIAAEAIGRRAVEQLLWRISHPEEDSRMHVVVEPELVPGEIA